MNSKEETREAFRESLVDVAAVVEKLTPLCPSTEDLLGVVKLALDNDAQLSILMQTMQTPPAQGKR